jgi:hypothetical protein
MKLGKEEDLVSPNKRRATPHGLIFFEHGRGATLRDGAFLSTPALLLADVQ